MFEPRVIKKINKAKLIGRGCNNFATAKKWQMVRNAKTKGDKFVICNASESEPGVFKDSFILEYRTKRVVDGLRIAMKTIGAKKGFIYLNPEYYEQFQEHLQAIIDEKPKHAIELYQKPLHDYVGGEETAVINSMQGQRVEPRMKPPYPTSHGFFNQPTLVNNCETLYAVSLINSGEYKHTRFYCLSGDGVSGRDAPRRVSTGDKNGKILELPTDITIRKALDAFNHQPSDKYFYQVGGGAGGNCYNHKQLNQKINGLASIIIYRVDRKEKDVVMNWLDFFENESCGQCVPCREGTHRLRNILEKYYATGEIDKDLFNDLIFTLQNTSFCPLGRISANAMLSYWKNVKGKVMTNKEGEKCEAK